MATPDLDPLLVRPGHDLRGPGDWGRVFGRIAPLEVEVGFGRDEGLIRRAAADPERDFLGIELKVERVQTYLGRVRRAGLANVRIVAGRAEVVLGILLPPGGVNAVRILFPDPWPKDRHAGNRLIQPYFLREVRRVLGPGGILWMATDDAAYQRQMVEVAESVGGFAGGPYDGPEERTPTDGITIFERKGIQQGRSIRYFRYRRLAEGEVARQTPE